MVKADGSKEGKLFNKDGHENCRCAIISRNITVPLMFEYHHFTGSEPVPEQQDLISAKGHQTI